MNKVLKWAEDHPKATVGILGVTFPVWAVPALLLGMAIMAYEGLMEWRGSDD